MGGVDADAAPTQMLTLNANNEVRITTLSGTADQGIVYTNGQYLLGATTTTAVPFTTNRFVNIDANNFSITANAGANTPLEITGGANSGVALTANGSGNVTLTSNATGDITLTSADDLTTTAVDVLALASATTNINTAAGNVNIGSATATNTILGTTNINVAGSQATSIGNATGTLTLTGATTLAGSLNQTGTGQVTFSGNVAASNGLDVTNANLTVGISQFTVDVATGNTAVAGTLDVDGVTTFNSAAALSNANELKFSEPTVDGTNYTSFKAGTQAADLEYTLPTTAPTSTNRVLTATTFANPMTLAWSNPNAEVVYGVDNTTAWGANQDNVAVPSEKTVMRVSSSADINLSGLNASVNGRIIVLVNVGANDITLKHNNSSTAGNQFKLPGAADIVLAPDGSVTLMYDTTSAVWRVLSVN